ncbi:MAG TPA: tetratricopeptide repeat protein [Chthoniobacterales bacterium]|nr:tetratricopeptide repeat protein [Chthoniobacterales bacterium]
MIFPDKNKQRLVSLVLCAATLLPLSACERAASREEKALRTQVRDALHQKSYEKAAELARRLLKLEPEDEGNWDRLIQAQFGLRDLTGVKQTLEEWGRAVKNPSPKLDEYTGDHAVEVKEPALAVEAWTKLLRADPKNTRVLEKLARLEKKQQHWAEENSAWTALIEAQDNATARINRALCRRRLHRWQNAFEDLERARELAPNDPEVLRGGKLLEQMGKFLPEIRELAAGLAVSPNDPGLLADRALMFLRSQDYEMALEDSTEAAKIGPWAVRPKLFQAMALIELGRADECEMLAVQKSIRLEALTPEFLETMGRLDSEISVERSNAELHVTRAWQLNEINQPALALQDAERAARLDPKSAGASAECSYALMKLGRADEALQQIKHATALDPTFATAWQYRGELEMARGETLSAIESLSQALETTQTAVALQKREECYRRLGLHVKAEQDRRALEELNKGNK